MFDLTLLFILGKTTPFKYFNIVLDMICHVFCIPDANGLNNDEEVLVTSRRSPFCQYAERA